MIPIFRKSELEPMLTYPEIDPVIFAIGPLKIRWYGLMYVVGFLLGHVAYPNIAAGHQLSFFDAASGFADEPRKILQGADFQGHGVLLIDLGRIGFFTQNTMDVVFHGDKCTAVPLILQPVEVIHIG